MTPMPRPHETPGVPLNARLNIPVPARLLAYLDTVRGEQTRAGYVRALIRAEANAAFKAGTYKPGEDPGQRQHYHENPQGPEDTTP